MIDNRKYTVEAQIIAENWWRESSYSVCSGDASDGLNDLAVEIEKALEVAHKRGFEQGLAQRDSEARSESESNDDNHNDA